MKPAISQSHYGNLPDGCVATLFTLVNASGLEMGITDFGAIVVTLTVPDREGAPADIVCGFDGLEGYLQNPSYYGCAVGRFCNRIAGGRFTLDGREFSLAVNNGPNHLHGGIVGFNKVLWQAEPIRRLGAVGVRFDYLSPDGEENYPGNLRVTMHYWLTDDNEFKIDYEAVTDAPTLVNLTNHSYFNLAGHGQGDIRGHELTLMADAFTPVDQYNIPTGEVRPVAGTPLDFRSPAEIGSRIEADDEQIRFGNGYDHNFVIRGWDGTLRPAARVVHADSGRVMEIETTEPGVQLYTGNFLDPSLPGKAGRSYGRFGAFCLETQHFPDSPNKPQFPTTALRPDDVFRSTTIHRFSAI